MLDKLNEWAITYCQYVHTYFAAKPYVHVETISSKTSLNGVNALIKSTGTGLHKAKLNQEASFTVDTSSRAGEFLLNYWCLRKTSSVAD